MILFLVLSLEVTAMMIPMLMVILVGIFEFGRAWHVRQVVTNAAREGARTAVLPDVGTDSVSAVVSSYLASANIDPAEAVITLKQGVGRLIRDEDDRGVLMLCDPRVVSRGYGKRFLSSLPPMPRTHSLADVEAFFRNQP